MSVDTLTNLVSEMRGVVMSSFLLHCKGKSLNIDPEVLNMLVRSYLGEEVNFTEMSPSPSPSKPEKKRKKKVNTVPSEFSRMPHVCQGKCMSRRYADGYGYQCSRNHADGEEYCKTHLKGLNAECIPVWGRIDEPRRRYRADNGKECNWKEYDGDGDIENISNDENHMCSSPSVSETSVSTDLTDIVSEVDNEPMTLTISSTETPVNMVESNDSLEDVVIAPEGGGEQDSAPVDSSDEAPVEAHEEDAHDEAPEEDAHDEAPEEAHDEAPEESHEEEAHEEEQEEQCNEVVPDDSLVSEPVTEEVPEKSEYPRMGKVQGVTYTFNKVEGEDDIIVQHINPLRNPIVMNVGYYDGELVMFNEEYHPLHELAITDEDQGYVEWI